MQPSHRKTRQKTPQAVAQGRHGIIVPERPPTAELPAVPQTRVVAFHSGPRCLSGRWGALDSAPGAAAAPATAAAAGEARDDDVEEGDDAADDGVEDVADAGDDGCEAVSDGAEDGLDLGRKEGSWSYIREQKDKKTASQPANRQPLVTRSHGSPISHTLTSPHEPMPCRDPRGTNPRTQHTAHTTHHVARDMDMQRWIVMMHDGWIAA
ncbi:hypothetical protein VDGL01_03675 [Verticillium dahliae]